MIACPTRRNTGTAMGVKQFNYRYRQTVLGVLRFFRQWHAWLTGKRFVCRALSGTSNYGGVFVNSDMTVSCNCQDIDGAGQIGSLRESTMEELLAGETASRFRHMLADGRLPIHRCAACFSIATAEREEARSLAQNYRLPNGFHVENTCNCNLKCLACCRPQVMQTRKGRFLSLGDVEVVAKTLRRMDATICGYSNLGEPFLSPNIRCELEIIRKYNPDIAIDIYTNGSLIDTDEKREAALLADRIVLSLDGVSTEMVNRYQRGGDFDRSYRNLERLVAFRDRRGRTKPSIGWLYVVFRWNDTKRDIQKAVELAEEAGVDYIRFRFARTPWYGVSWRFLLSPFFRSLGHRTDWRHREVRFSQPVSASREAA